MFEKGKSSAGGTHEAGTLWRRSGTSPWSRSRRRAAAYAASVDHLEGLMAMRTR